MAPHPAPRSGCTALPLFVTGNGLHKEQAVTGRERAPQGTGSDWKNLPGKIFQALPTQTDIVALIYRIPLSQLKT
jgi:hypothetical protein